MVNFLKDKNGKESSGRLLAVIGGLSCVLMLFFCVIGAMLGNGQMIEFVAPLSLMFGGCLGFRGFHKHVEERSG